MFIKKWYYFLYSKILIKKEKNQEEINKFDWKLFLLSIVLILLGIVILVVKVNSRGSISCSMHRLNLIVYLILGVIEGGFIYFFNYKKIKNYSLGIYYIATIIMLSPYVSGFVFQENGIYYIRIIRFTIQIVTIALPLYIISFIGFLMDEEKNNIKSIKHSNKKFKLTKKKIGIFISAIISLILMIVDLSFTNMVILAISYLIIITSKIMKDKEKRMLKLGTIYGVIFSIICAFTIIIFLQQSINWNKVKEYINVNIESADNGSNMLLQREIIRNAKMVGEAENLSVPIDETVFYSESNYTFIYIIGKLGLYYAELIALVYVFIALKLMSDVKKVKDEYGRYLMIGLSSLFIVQSFATMFVNISLGIYADVNLPFITYGGSYFIINMFEIALIFSIYRRRDMYNNIESEENKIEEKILIKK